ncbi:MAG: cytochrome b/b6 domain-containing protein, partial [Gammaproteobacteria bacterium]|nr:cytochrome b/b6 domain-containing protein [Gammaproteobacteria bacterium]
SIALHWITAIVILYLLYLGSSIDSLVGDDRTDAITRHTSVAIVTYLLLLGRIVWRFAVGHPGPTDEQRGAAHTLGRWTHYAMLVAMIIMLITGPLMQFSYGRDIAVFDWFQIPTPFEASFALADGLHLLHTYSALFIFFAILLHIGGVYKHTAFNQDGTLAKIIIPGRQSSRPTSARPGQHGSGHDQEGVS